MDFSENKKLSVEYNTRLTGFTTNSSQGYLTSVSGKIRTVKVSCPKCSKVMYVDNGYHAVEDSVITQLGLKIRIAQFYCKNCSTHWSTNREIVDELIKKEKDFRWLVILSLVGFVMSLGPVLKWQGKTLKWIKESAIKEYFRHYKR